MASKKEFVEYIADQLAGAGDVRVKLMFGDYALYLDDKIIGLMCDNRLVIKATEGGRIFISNPVEASPYPGAKPGFLIEEQLDDREWLQQLARITFDELPVPRKKKKRPAK